MLILLYETTRILSISEKFKSRFPKTAILYCNRFNFDEVLSKISTPHLISDRWLVNVGYNVSNEQIEKLSKTDNVFILKYNTKSRIDTIKSYLDEKGVEFVYYDNTKVDKKKLIQFIMNDINVTEDLAKFIVNRSNEYLPAIENTLDRLKMFDKVTKDIITEYTEKRVPTSFYTLFQALIGLNTIRGKKVNVSSRLKRCIKLVEAYQYKPSPIYKFLLSEINKYLHVYNFIIEGSLTLANYENFMPYDEDEIFKNINRNQIPYIFEAFQVVSYDKLYAIKMQLQNIKPNSIELYKLVAMLSC